MMGNKSPAGSEVRRSETLKSRWQLDSTTETHQTHLWRTGYQE